MTPAHIVAVLTTVTTLLALGWLYQALIALRGMPTVPDLTGPQATWPRLPQTEQPHATVVVPACNEEPGIAATLRSLLASSGVNLQIVAVNDRSTDRTGTIMDQIAAQAREVPTPHTLEVLHIHELPAGWLGKTHALARGAERSQAPWLLFTDGDLLFHPRALALALRYAEADRADHLVLAFTLDIRSLAESAVLAAFQACAAWNVRLWKVADPQARDFFGAGGFNLVRRSAYQALGGFASLRMEVVEDLRLGWMLKRAGYRQRAVVGPDLVRIRWLQGAFGLVSLLEKNGFAGLRYRTGLALAAFLGFAVQIVVPLAALACGRWGVLACAAFYAAIALTYYANRRLTQASPWTALLFAPAASIGLFALIRSTVLTLGRQGVVWRGTKYPLAELRRHAGTWR